MVAPLRRAPRPRTASNVSPDARLTTRAARAPSSSTAHRLVAYQGMPLRGVGGSVQRVDHHHHGGVAAMQARLLGQDPDPGRVEHRQRGGVGRQVAAVLAGPGAGRPPVVEPAQRSAHGAGRGAQEIHQGVVIHGSATVAARPPPWQA